MSPLSDYSDMESEISNAPDPEILKRGEEVKARIISVKSGISEKNNAGYFMPNFDVPDRPTVKSFNTFFWDLADKSKLTPKQIAQTLAAFKNFAACFGIDYSRPFSWEDDLPGKTGWIIAGVQKDDQYGDKNTISKYVVGAGPARKVASADDDIPF